ncbi:ribonuclease [Burkholderia sp. PAMC 28687]|nr:ribonuclease [Burkholderia sp. PAMC 26561]AMM15306.1 ribonuclease [Burkholderia sp. PAMC 28687]
MKRAWVCGFLTALLVVLSGCGKSAPDSPSPGGNSPAAASQAQSPLAVQDKNRPQSDPRRENRRDAASAGLESSQTTVDAAQLPKQAVVTLRRIEAGGPFPYEKDGIVFGNRERMLPPHPRGYYREYTVPTPRARDRGARRIVCGGPRRQIDNCFYSDDHYVSFKRIAGLTSG